MPVGGVASQILELLPAYEKISNLKIFLITKYSEYTPSTNKIKIIKINKFKNRKIDEIYFFFKSFKVIVQLHKKEKIDAINIHTYYYNVINPFLLRILYKIPLLITTPGDFRTHQREEFMSNPHSLLIKMFYYSWMKFFIKILLKQKRIYLQAINKKIYNDLLKSGFPERNICKIPNGISSKYYINIKKTLRKEIHFGYVGRLIKSKNIRFLLRSFLKHLSNYPDDKLVMFGDGPEKKYILNFISRFNLEKNVIFWGFEKDKKVIFAEIDVLIHPTFGEGVPMTILEAILTNTSIIASNVSGIKDIIEHEISGLLFNPFREEDLVDKLKFYRENQHQIEDMKVIAKEKVLLNYDIKIVSNQVFQFLKSRLGLNT